MTELVDNRSIVVPGEPVYEGTDKRPGDGTLGVDGEIHSRYVGTVNFKQNEVRVTPLSGRYIPEKGDSVIGEVSRVSHSNWTVELNSPYSGVLPVSEGVDDYVDLAEDDISDYYDIGDVIITKIQKVTRGKDVQLTMDDRNAEKIENGRVVSIAPSKVPRLIGRKGSMVNTIRDYTNTEITIGQNGRVWIRGEHEGLAAKACRKVDREAHHAYLQDTIEEFLDERRRGEH